jgi:hypothetical protein
MKMNSNGLIQKIKRQNKLIGVVIVSILFGIIGIAVHADKKFRKNCPELLEVKLHLHHSNDIKDRFGEIRSVEISSYRYSKSLSDGSKDGCFDFQITGKKANGVHRICWEKKNDSALKVVSSDSVRVASFKDAITDIYGLLRGDK